MKLILYKNKAESNRLDKTDYLEKIYELDGTLRDKCSIISPIIQVQLVELTKICQCNYAYIADFGRYYYIDDVVGEYNSIVTLYMRSDPLMSFKDPILDLDVVALRNEYNYSYKLIDEKLPSKCEWDIKTDEFSSFHSFYPTNGDFTVSMYYKIQFSSNYTYSDTFDGGVLMPSNRIIYCNKTGLVNFLNATLSNNYSSTNFYKDNWTEGLISVSMIPVNLSKYGAPIVKLQPDVASGKYIFDVVGSTIQVNSDGSEFYDISNARISESFPGTKFDSVFRQRCELNIQNISKDDIYFLNLSPFTKTMLAIPYIGVIDFDISYLYEYDKILLTYYYDSCSCNLDCTIELIKDSNKILYKTLSIDLTVSIPITRTNSNDINRNKIFSVIQGALTIGSIAATAYGGGIGLTSGSSLTMSESLRNNYSRINPDNLTSSFTNVSKNTISKIGVGAIANRVGNMLIGAASSMVERVSVSQFSGCYTNWYFLKYAYLIRIVTKVADYGRTTSYSHLIGRPCEYNGKLSGLNGYTEIGGVHIEFNQLNYSPLIDEIEEIDSILRNGIILPDKPAS